jgi:hypothetical protein
MAPSGNHIRVPKPSASSFNKDRPVSKNALLENQVKHFHELEMNLLEKLQTGIRYEDVRTEGDAAEYIRRMTAILHPHLAESAGK